jgi:hypothetical protein
LIEADDVEHAQKAKDCKISVQNPCILSYTEIADHLLDGRVAWTQEAINDEYKHKKDGTDYSSKYKESCKVAPSPSRAYGMYFHVYGVGGSRCGECGNAFSQRGHSFFLLSLLNKVVATTPGFRGAGGKRIVFTAASMMRKRYESVMSSVMYGKSLPVKLPVCHRE